MNDLVIVSPMSSMTGYITYVEYGAATAKGDVSIMGIDENGDTTGSVFNNPFGLGKVDPDYTSSRVVEPVTSFTSGTTKIAFGPVAKDAKGAYMITFLDGDGNELEATGVSVAEDRTVTATISSGTVAKIAYVYDNVVIPQDTIPSIKAQMKSIPLLAKARRIAVYYSQIAAFQA